MADDSWKKPPGGFRYRNNSPAGHVERALAALRQPRARRVVLIVALITLAAILVSR